MHNISIIDTRSASANEALKTLRQRLSPDGTVVSEAGRQKTIEVFGQPLSPQQVVETICREVRSQGLPAVLDYSAKIDRADITAATLRVTAEELQTAHAAASPEFLASVRRIRDNIWQFQTSLLHQTTKQHLPDGSYLAHRYLPLQRVGICVPGGAAAYPSTVLMTAVPAQVAGVKELAVVAPPTPFGSYNQDLLATCHELGIREVYRVGGAQAVAALAYGVEGLPKVDKIVGPGNLFVALAKKQVYGDVDIDAIAGPSEVVVLADGSASPEFIAADLIAQAEHSPGASILIAWQPEVIEATLEAIDRQLIGLERGDLAKKCLQEFGAFILAKNEAEACELTTAIAPEHLAIMTEHPELLMEQIPSAGAVFLGTFSPVASGDYAAGPSHVLPTGGTGRFASGLSANDFLRSHSVIALSEQRLKALAPDIQNLALKEGLTAHWASVRMRVEQ